MTDSLLATVDAHVKDGDETALMAYAIGLPAEQIPGLLRDINERIKILKRLADVLSARASADGLKAYTAPTGETFSFGTGRKRVVSDPVKMRDVLQKIIVEKFAPFDPMIEHPHHAALNAAFKEQEPKVYLKELDIFLALDKRYAKAAEDYITWEDASKTPRLKPRYER